MKLNLDFTKYIGKTLLKDWWPVVLGHMRQIQSAVNANDTAITAEVSDRKSAVSGEASARQSADTALGKRIDGKADAVHKHVKADITDFTHTHKKADITDFPETMAPTDGSVTMDKLASDVKNAINGATGLDELDELTDAVYGPSFGKIEVRECKIKASYAMYSSGAEVWGCNALLVLPDYVFVNGNPVVTPEKTVLNMIRDSRPGKTVWEIRIRVNLRPGNNPVNTILDPEYESISEDPGDVYPRVISADTDELRFAVGCFTLPADRSAEPSKDITVPAGSVTYEVRDCAIHNDYLATDDKSSILAAVNELAAKAGTEALERESADTALGQRIDGETAARETLVKEVGIPQLKCTLYGADFKDYEIGREYLVKIVGNADAETGTVWFKDHVPCSYTGDPSYYANRSGQEVKVGGTYALTKFSEPHRPEDDDIGEYIDGEVSFVESSVMDWAQRNIFGFDSLTERLTELEASVEYLQDNVIYRMDGVE